MNLVVGEISYTNILPLYYYLNRKQLDDRGCLFVPKIPSQLNQEMSEGLVDVGGISSFEYGQNSEKYTLLPNLSVSSNGAVGSIFLFSKKPIEKLDLASIALTSSSATSLHLLKIILKHFYHFTNDYEVMTPSITDMLSKHDACLLIGDDAILTLWQEGDRYYRYDLGELWYQHTKLPMTYAVFAVRNEVLQSAKPTLELLYQQFKMSKERSIKLLFVPMIHEIQQKFGGDFEFWNMYFQGLCYDLGAKELKGLKYYYDLAFQYGFIKKKIETIALWNEVEQCHSM